MNNTQISALAQEIPENRAVVASLFGLAIFSQVFLLGVAVSGTSFYGQENPFPDYFSPRMVVSKEFDTALTAIADNLVWSFSLASHSLKMSALSFLGIEQDQPVRVSSLGKPGTWSLYQQSQDYDSSVAHEYNEYWQSE